MKKYTLSFILFNIGIILISCGKDVVMSYELEDNNSKIEVVTPLNPTPNKNNPNNDFSLIGIWDGNEVCKNCCIKESRFMLIITDHEGEHVKGSLMLAKLDDQRYFMDFEVDMKFNESKGILTVKRTRLIKEVGITNDLHCSICLDNVMELTLSEDKKGFVGKWVKTKEGVQNCETALKGGSIIKIVKTK